MIEQFEVHPSDFSSYDTQRIRDQFLYQRLMKPGELTLAYTHYDRFVYGGAVPLSGPIHLGNYDPLKADFFLQRRELGVLNVGGKGTVTVDGTAYELDKLEVLYVGRGAQEVSFDSADKASPAKFYLNSAPAHKEYPTTKYTQAQANQVELGDKTNCNERVIYQYIHEGGIQSCQLVMGYTELKPGSIWNTFPPHTHHRRMEVYFYFDVPADQLVMHFMGAPTETRHIVMKNEDAVVSPPWSIHAGAGTQAYFFAWGMAGENQSFTDMDAVSYGRIK